MEVGGAGVASAMSVLSRTNGADIKPSSGVDAEAERAKAKERSLADGDEGGGLKIDTRSVEGAPRSDAGGNVDVSA